MALISSNGMSALADCCAAALVVTAEGLDCAGDCAEFLGAIDANRHLWMTLIAIARHYAWEVPGPRLGEMVMRASQPPGRCIQDRHVEFLIDINRHTAARLAAARDLAVIRSRAESAWKTEGHPFGLTMLGWLMAVLSPALPTAR